MSTNSYEFWLSKNTLAGVRAYRFCTSESASDEVYIEYYVAFHYCKRWYKTKDKARTLWNSLVDGEDFGTAHFQAFVNNNGHKEIR